jgi:hypothetical protein
VKSLSEFANVIVIEAVDIQLHHTDDLVVIFGSRGHRSLPFFGLHEFTPMFPASDRRRFRLRPGTGGKRGIWQAAIGRCG